MANEPIRLAYIVSHPIQYQAPLLRRIAQEPGIDLTVFFCSDFSVKAYLDSGFGTTFQWDVDLLGGYRHVVLPRWRETSSPRATRPIAYRIFRELKKGSGGKPFDAVWVHGYASINALHAYVAAKALGIPVLVRAEGWLGDRPRTSRTLFLKCAFFGMIKPFLSAALAIGTQNRRYWETYLGSDFPIFLMPYAVDNQFFRSRAEEAASRREQLQQQLNLDPARPVILFASKLQQRKHCDHLLEAYLGLLTESDPAALPYLLIVGDGEQRALLEDRVQQSGCNSVRFLGFQNQGELPRYFDLSDIFVLPSRYEPWGLIVNEAMNAGLAVIVSNEVGSAADLVEDGVTGYVFPVEDIELLKQALQRCLQSPEITKHMGQQARLRISQWSFQEDIAGLRQALEYTTGKKIPSEGSGQ